MHYPCFITDSLTDRVTAAAGDVIISEVLSVSPHIPSSWGTAVAVPPLSVQAWQPCPLWEPSRSHPILLWTRGLAVFVCLLIVYLCYLCIFWFLQFFDTVGWVF